MLSVKTEKGWLPIVNRSNFKVVYDYEGNQTLSFDINTNDDMYPHLYERSLLRYRTNTYLVIKINQRKAKTTVTAEICLDEWKRNFFHNFHTEYKLFSEVINLIIPSGWFIEGAGSVTGRRAITLEGVNGYDILMQCKKTYNIVFEYHTENKLIKIVKPDVTQSRGLYITDELNLKNLEFKGDTSTFCTRLYAFGKKTETRDDAGNVISTEYVNFAELNQGNTYVDNNDYTQNVISTYWQDDRYTDPQSLLDDAIDKLKVLANPVRSYSCQLIDLSRINEKYRYLDFKLYDKVTLIDSISKTHIMHQIVEYTDYPDNPNLNTVSLSSVFKKITGTIDGIKQSISSIDTEIRRNESTINEIIRDVESNTLRINKTYTKGETDTLVESLIQQSAEEINMSVQEITNNIKRIRFTSHVDDDGLSLSYAIPTSEARAVIYDYGVDVTDKFLDEEINWIRKSNNPEGDEYWNYEYGRARKKITITRDDLHVKASFGFEFDTTRYEQIYPDYYIESEEK